MLEDPNSCRVLLVEENRSLRRNMVDTLRRTFGFKEITVAANFMETEARVQESFQLALLPAFDLNGVSVLTFLSNLINKNIKSPLVAIMLENEGEEFILPGAFEIGALFYIHKDYTTKTFEKSIGDLITLAQLHDFHYDLVAADCAKKFLIKQKKYRTLKQLFTNMVNLHPGNPRLLLNLAESFFLNEEKNLALVTLNQVAFINEGFVPICQDLCVKYNTEFQTSDDLTGINALDISSCIAIDPDTDCLHNYKKCLKLIGVPEFKHFSNAKDAIQELITIKKSSQKIDLILIEWKQFDIPGFVLIQKIRSIGLTDLPIIVVSSQVHKEDSSLLIEMGASAILTKPFNHQKLLSSISNAIQKHRYPKEKQLIEQKIRGLLQAGNLAEAERLLEEYKEIPNILKHEVHYLQALYYFHAGDNHCAMCKAQESLEGGNENPFLKSLLGKIFLKQRKFSEALAFFKEVNVLCNNNIERLLDLSIASVHVGENQNAVNYLAQAKEVDPENPDIKKVEYQVNISVGNIHKASSILLKDLDNANEILSFMNIQAVCMVHSKQYLKAFETYQKAISSIPQKLEHLLPFILYNLSLAYARSGDLDKAANQLSKLLESNLENIQLRKKCVSLIRKIEKTKFEGAALQLSNSTEIEIHDKTDPFNDNNKQINKLIMNLTIKEGSFCLYKLLINIDPIDQQCEKLLEEVNDAA